MLELAISGDGGFGLRFPVTSAHRLVSIISVVGCGTLQSSGIQPNLRHEIKSLTSGLRTGLNRGLAASRAT